MEIRPAMDYSFEAFGGKLTVRWFWEDKEGLDDERFTLAIVTNTLGHGVPMQMTNFLNKLPFEGTYEEVELLLQEGIHSLKKKGFSIQAKPFNTGWN